jgi:hypothetical protein
LPIVWKRPLKPLATQQDDYMPFVEMDPDELRQLLADVRDMVGGISAYIREVV